MDDKPHVIERVATLLRAVGDHEPAGSSTSDLARYTRLARPTTHRLLTALSAEGFVDRDHTTGRWTLGPEIYLLGSLAADRYDITGSARDILRRLSRDTGESAFLSTRRGDETVCVAAEEGNFPLRSHVLHPGIRFPLGVASAGLVILAHLTDREIDDYLGRIDLTDRHGAAHTSEQIRTRIEATREQGYSVNPGLLVEGSWGIGAAVFDHRGTPAWALSLTGVETRFSPERRPELGTILLQAAHELSQRLHPGLLPSSRPPN
ncbi:IclR family transcriptional regulator [Nocardia brevicatena]|uniref:IclR family transcriptional regulator n=1 Tax=Nocardia brevicatena TaxID=37327 RepID=UPI0002D5D29F|nr:IclR family transcriptional regulator [Nocardia brevicatena]